MVTDAEATEVSDEKEETVEVDRAERGALRLADDDDMAAGEQKRRRGDRQAARATIVA